ncbi:MAG: uroporphyrinogen-III synthase [Burkholderiales bacterium]|jgi:uroporphyrinogen III methyltransferase/synthase
MSDRPVVIMTRPVEQAADLTSQLQQWGYAVQLLPALTIEPVVWSEQTRTRLQRLAQFDFVHFSSPNAIRYALEPLYNKGLSWSGSVHIGLMGHGSQHMMRRYYPESEALWITPPEQGPWDSESLIQVMAQQSWLKNLHRALLVKGQGGREVLADWLRSRSVEVEYAEVYSRRTVEWTPQIEASLMSLARAERCIWLLSSSEGTKALGKVLSKLSDAQLQHELWHSVALVSHERVALAAQGAGFQQVIVCNPGEKGLKAALESLHD